MSSKTAAKKEMDKAAKDDELDPVCRHRLAELRLALQGKVSKSSVSRKGAREKNLCVFTDLRNSLFWLLDGLDNGWSLDGGSTGA